MESSLCPLSQKMQGQNISTISVYQFCPHGLKKVSSCIKSTHGARYKPRRERPQSGQQTWKSGETENSPIRAASIKCLQRQYFVFGKVERVSERIGSGRRRCQGRRRWVGMEAVSANAPTTPSAGERGIEYVEVDKTDARGGAFPSSKGNHKAFNRDRKHDAGNPARRIAARLPAGSARSGNDHAPKRSSRLPLYPQTGVSIQRRNQ